METHPTLQDILVSRETIELLAQASRAGHLLPKIEGFT